MKKQINFGLFLGVLLLSFSALLLQVSLTRVFSIGKWYHFAFMVVSIALLGYGLSGSILTVFEKTGKNHFYKTLSLFSLLFFFSTLTSFFATNSIPFDPFRVMHSAQQWLNIALHYLFLSVPFFSVGCVLALAFKKHSRLSGKIYFFDLIGAALGALFFLFFAVFFSPVKIIFLACFFSLIASVLFSLHWNKRVSLSLLIFSLLFFSVSLTQGFSINISPYKQLNTAMNFPQAELLYTAYNPVSRVDVVESPAVKVAPGLSTQFRGKFPEQYGLLEDASGLNTITKFDDVNREFLSSLPSFIPFALSNQERILLLGADSLNLVSSFKESNAGLVLVEENPLMVKALKEEFGEFSGQMLESDRVKIQTQGIRAFIRSTPEKFDLIQLKLSESIFASTTGLYGLSECYQFTTEAFQDYYSALGENGYLYMGRWLSFPPKESLRISSTIKKALEAEGVKEPEKHIFVFRTLTTVSFLVKKEPFTVEEIQKAKQFCEKNSFDIVFYSGIKESEVNRYNKFPEPYYYQFTERIFSKESEGFYSGYLFDVKAVNDDKPYFFNFFKWSKFQELFESMHKKWEPFFEGGFLVYTILLQAVILSVALIFAPVLFIKKIKPSLKGKKHILSYFFFIGLGFMFFEIISIQKFVLFLGQPVYSFSMLVALLLVSSGIGAFYSNKIKELSKKNFSRILLVIGALLFLFTLLSSPLVFLLLGLPLLLKALLLVLIVFPIGFFLGMPFPLGIRLAKESDDRMVTWGYAFNGCASVIGSVGAIVVAINFGHSLALLLSALFYLIAFMCVFQFFRS